MLCLAFDYSIYFTVAGLIMLNLQNLKNAVQVLPFQNKQENTRLILGEFALAVASLLLPFLVQKQYINNVGDYIIQIFFVSTALNGLVSCFAIVGWCR